MRTTGWLAFFYDHEVKRGLAKSSLHNALSTCQLKKIRKKLFCVNYSSRSERQGSLRLFYLWQCWRCAAPAGAAAGACFNSIRASSLIWKALQYAIPASPQIAQSCSWVNFILHLNFECTPPLNTGSILGTEITPGICEEEKSLSMRKVLKCLSLKTPSSFSHLWI